MLTLSIALTVLAALALGIMWFIGLFNKRVNGHVNLIMGFARTLKVNKENTRRLLPRLRLLIKLLPRKKGLILLKMLKRIRANRQERINQRRDKRHARKTNRKNKKPLK
jgi:hypothetical protein